MDINDRVLLDIHVTGRVVGRTFEDSPRVDIVVEHEGRKCILANIPAAWLRTASQEAA